MRIAHYDPHITANGGIACYVRRIGNAQAERGHQVFFLTLEDNLPEKARWTNKGRPIQIATEHDLEETCSTINVDLLHIHRPIRSSVWNTVPVVRTVHGNGANCPSGSRYLKRSGQLCNRRYTVGGCLWGHLVDHCGSRRPHKTLANFQNIRLEQQQATEVPTITVSRFLKEQMIRSGCAPDNLHVIHSPAPDVHTDFTPLPMNAPPRFLFAGRIEPNKGLDWLLRAVARVKAPIHLDVAGSGSERYLTRMRGLVADLGIDDRVTFHGWLDEDEVLERMRNARAVVFPSVWHEPAGLITLEAAAVGRPVIASAVGGIPEYALDDFALHVPVRDIDALSAAINQLATAPDRAEQMGWRALHVARTRFTMDRFTRRVEGLYERALDQHAASIQH